MNCLFHILLTCMRHYENPSDQHKRKGSYIMCIYDHCNQLKLDNIIIVNNKRKYAHHGYVPRVGTSFLFIKVILIWRHSY